MSVAKLLLKYNFLDNNSQRMIDDQEFVKLYLSPDSVIIETFNQKWEHLSHVRMTRLEIILLLLYEKSARAPGKYGNILINIANGELIKELIYQYDPSLLGELLAYDFDNTDVGPLSDMEEIISEHQKLLKDKVTISTRIDDRELYLRYWFMSTFSENRERYQKLKDWFIKFANVDDPIVSHRVEYEDHCMYVDIYSTPWAGELQYLECNNSYEWDNLRPDPNLTIDSILEKFSKIDQNLPNEELMNNLLHLLHLNFEDKFEDIGDNYLEFYNDEK